MPSENPELELARLLKEQRKARNDEIFLRLSPAEREQFEARRTRIQTLQLNAVPPSTTAEPNQRRNTVPGQSLSKDGYG
jgi:hypothetical protein